MSPGAGHGDPGRRVDLGLLFPIQTPRRGGRWLLGGAILAALLTFFWVCGVFTESIDGDRLSPGPALFFSAIIAYVVPIFGYISERTVVAIDSLRGVLDADARQVDGWRDRVQRKPVAWFVIVVLIGTASGIGHNVLLFLSSAELEASLLQWPPQLALVVGTQLTWIVVTLVVAGLLDNATMLFRAARRCAVPLLNTRRLRPFATVAVISTLAIIGAQAAFPIMNVGGASDAVAYIPGLLGTGVPMLLLAALPVWPVHRRISSAKERALADVNAAIAARPAPDPDRPQTLAELAPLLAYRRELQQVSEWPFDLGVVTRLALYLIIPPLTWVGAALIENLVEALL